MIISVYSCDKEMNNKLIFFGTRAHNSYLIQENPIEIKKILFIYHILIKVIQIINLETDRLSFSCGVNAHDLLIL